MSIKEILEELPKLSREGRQQIRTWLDSEDFPETDALLAAVEECRRRVPFHGTGTDEEPRRGSTDSEAMRYRVEITPLADDDLAEIVSYVAKDDPLKAEAFGMELVDQALMLSTPTEARACGETLAPANWFMAST